MKVLKDIWKAHATLASFLFTAATLMASTVCWVSMANAEPRNADERQADADAIRQSAKDYSAAFEKGDAKAVAAFWTETGEYHEENGESIVGRAALEKAYAEHFKSKPKGKVDIEIVSIHFPSRDTAIEDGVIRASQSGPELPTSTRYSVLHVREDGKWKVAVTREWGADNDKLHDLQWLIGNWAAKSKDHEIDMRFEWNATKTLIRNHFTTKEGGKVTASGTQIIGLDPKSGRLRSYMFDDEGGRGESLWVRDGSRWVLESVGVTPGASDTKSLNIIARINDDAFSWRSIDRVIGDRRVADTDPVKVTRVKAGK